MSDLYDADILEWSLRQAALLRRVAAGERVNDSDLDWPDIIEEIESVGREQLHRVESLLYQALLHHLKALAWPDSPAVPGWQAKTRGFLAQARRRFAPLMRQKLDLDGLYADALQALPASIGARPPRAVPPHCPFTLAALLADDRT